MRPGQKLSVQLIANELREAGYSLDGASQTSQLGTFTEGVQTDHRASRPAILHAQDSATIHVSAGVVESITDDRTSRSPATSSSRC